MTTLMADPMAIASMTAELPGSSWRSAITAEASSTDATENASSASATALGCVLGVLGARFGPPLRDQLVSERAAGCFSEHAPRGLRRCAPPLDLDLRGLDRMLHTFIVSGAPAAEGEAVAKSVSRICPEICRTEGI